MMKLLVILFVINNGSTSIELMTQNARKVNAAIRFPSETEGTGTLPSGEQTIDLLKEKHPEGASKFDGILLDSPEESYEEYADKGINGALNIKLQVKLREQLVKPRYTWASGWCPILTSSSFGDNT